MIEIAAELVKEFGLKQDDIAELDRWWIAFVYFHPRGKYGELKVRSKPREGGPRLSSRDAWIKAAGANWGYHEWYAERQYDAMMAEKSKAMPQVEDQSIIVSAMPQRLKSG